MAYDQTYIELARKRGAPDPEGNVRRARAIVDLINASRLEEATSRLLEITDLIIHHDLITLMEFQETCLCIRPKSA